VPEIPRQPKRPHPLPDHQPARLPNHPKIPPSYSKRTGKRRTNQFAALRTN
jgi:hypothetical protein